MIRKPDTIKRETPPGNNDRQLNLTLLLDLDDTLLDSNMDTFLPVYFQALSDNFASRIAPELMIPALMASTRKMIANEDPSRTLQEIFDSEFFPHLGVEREEYQAEFDAFYDTIFPTLSNLTNPRPEAIDFIEWADSQGCRLAIATNPLFPLKAIHERMRWAGIPPGAFPFVVVSAYEDFHFSKPNPAYFAEVLARMGWPEGPAIMVGDDPERDLIGSNRLGLPAYWITPTNTEPPTGITMVGQGQIGDLRTWILNTDQSRLDLSLATPEALIAVLLSTPAAIMGLLAPDRERGTAPDPKQRPIKTEWSLTEIICHLRDTEMEVNLARLKMVLEQDEPFIPALETNTWAQERDYINQDLNQALQDFSSLRMQMVAILRELDHEWERKARHAIFGPTDLGELVGFVVEHDKLHIRQLWATLEQISS